MKTNRLTFFVSTIVLLMLAAGVAGAQPQWSWASPLNAPAVVSGGISYQGQLTTPEGLPLDGSYAMRFILYDADVGGSALWDSGAVTVSVNDGLFSVKLGVEQASFDGKALWLSIIVEDETLSPRQEILPAPYALSLRPGADIVGDSLGADDAVVAGYAPATGTALHADANGGAGLYGISQQNYGVQGMSDTSWGGYFSSENGYGVRIETRGTDHFDHGAYITSEAGYGIYAQSANNMAVRGEAGDITGMASPIGAVGVVGMGENRGTYGASLGGIGVYGTSQSNYGVWGTSADFRGVTGRTGRSDNNYGLYTPDNLFANNVSFAGSMTQVMRNDGADALAPGDVVVFSGISQLDAAADVPIVHVSKANAPNSTAVAGVVSSRFNIDAVDLATGSLDALRSAGSKDIEVTPSGEAAPGDYVLVVVQGIAQVNMGGSRTSNLVPGDLLATSDRAGSAAKASTLSTNELAPALPGTVFGKALEPYDGEQEKLYVYVTLQ